MPHPSDASSVVSEETFRDEVHAFLAEAVPADIRAATQANCLVTREQAARWHRILHARGWAAPGWPREHGGPGWSLVQQAIFREELAASDAPHIENLGIDTIGPTLIRHGTPEQCRKFLPGMLSFDDFWAQGYSEPDAGSDLAALRTTARLDDCMWCVNGTKIWQSLGHWANWALVLVRTDPRATRKQDGISVLLVDLRSPGVTVRPIRYINGSHFHVQIFFDDVRVPAENLVGPVDNGWAIAKGLLVIERLFVARMAECKAELASAARLVRARQIDHSPELRVEHALLARRHAELDIRTRTLEAAWWPAVRMAAEGGSPDLEASLLKLEGIQLLQDLHLFQTDAHGTESLRFHPEALDGQPGSLSGTAEHAANLALHMWRYRGSSLAGGSSEIQKQIIAKAIFAGQTEIDRPRNDHLSEQQAMMVDTVRRWLGKHYTFDRRQRIVGAQGGFDQEAWTGLCELGLVNLAIPESAGGLGQSMEDLLPLVETLGEALVLEPLPWNAVLVVQALLATPAGPARDTLLEAVASGDALCALACGDDSGSGRSWRPKVTAQQARDSWRLGGIYPLVMGGAQAHRFIVAALREDGSAALFDVPADVAGVATQAYQLHDGRGAASLRLDAVTLPPSALLAGGATVAIALESALSFATLALCAESIGAMRQALGITVEYLRTRKQFGRTLAEQQVLQHRVVDHYRAWHGARHLVRRTLAGWQTASPAERKCRVSAAKYTVGMAGRAIALDVLQLHGAIGLQDETPISHYSKRLMGNDLLLGNAAAHLGRFAAATEEARP
ncbi:acyl-CoA dehydrogenase family protein [Cupriavidus sp. WKF15]|uniref:acyl-CoA dehydrogenase family protein n=1 Tax=Cupriavidus sp. WKF15 TaxID=3032282 RepID=UPI0023E274C7|nr:acyl-CoA dehydrogenase family protein [Cupriavidus sp. WKF15]WER45685.1 acyl-CoA dehydrogenase family protein [Cupriavidus sp. WKF15]